MRRTLIALTIAGALAASGCAARSAASQPPAPAAAHQHPASAPSTDGDGGRLATQLARSRLATARYATNLHAAKADGYQIITRMIPDMGWHFLNPTIQGFDVTKPPILVYERHGRSWQLGALEWVFPEKPATPPLPGATYGSFAAACHYTRRHLRGRPRPRTVPQAQPRDGGAIQLLASRPGDPARVGLVPQSRRPLQRHQLSGTTLQPRLDHASQGRASSPTSLGPRPRRAGGAGLPAKQAAQLLLQSCSRRS